MANLISKIDQLGLKKPVQELMAEGIIVGRQIDEILSEEHGVKISDSAVCRCKAKVREQLKPDEAANIRDRIGRDIPKNSNSLENIQVQPIVGGEMRIQAKWVERKLCQELFMSQNFPSSQAITSYHKLSQAP